MAANTVQRFIMANYAARQPRDHSLGDRLLEAATQAGGGAPRSLEFFQDGERAEVDEALAHYFVLASR